MFLAFKPLEENYGKQQWHMRFGRWGHYRRMPPFLRLHRISLSLFTVSQSSSSVGETVAYSILILKCHRCQQRNQYCFVQIFLWLCICTNPLPTLQRAGDSQTQFDLWSSESSNSTFYFYKIFFLKSVLLRFLVRVFRSLLYILNLKGILWPRCCFPHPQMYHTQQIWGSL